MWLNDRRRMDLSREFFLIDTSELLRAGIDLLRALEFQAREPGLKGVQAARFAAAVRSGTPLSAVMSTHGFPAVAVSLTRIGEATGDLSSALRSAGGDLERRRGRRERIGRLLSYPLLLAVLAMAVIYLLAGWVVPNFARMYAALHLPMSRAAQFTIFLSAAVGRGFVPALCTAAGIALVSYASRRFWQGWLTGTLARLGLMGGLFRLAKGRDSMDVFATLLGAGIDLLTALETMANVDLAGLGGRWEGVRDDVARGGSLSVSLAQIKELPLEVAALVSLAEQTGDLSQGAERAAAFFGRVFDRKAERLARLAEPATVVILGVVVGAATLLLTLPMMDLVRKLS